MHIQGLFDGVSRSAQRLLGGLTLFILITVLGMGWFQYRQIEQVTEKAMLGYDNFVWEFFELELHLIRYQKVLREALAQPDKIELQVDTSEQYNIFASQVLLIHNGTVADILRDKEIFQFTQKQNLAYLEKADPYFENFSALLNASTLNALLQDSHALQAQVHKLVLEVHQVQSQRSTGKLEEIRNFAMYGAVISAFLLLLSLGLGLIALGQLAIAGRRQRELENLHIESSHRAAHDALTNLVNRSEFEKHLSRALDSTRHHQSEHAVMFVDLDRFKIVNDTCGHSAGDQLLRDVVGVIANCVRSTDVFGRLGGDEFGVILMHCGPEKASEVAEQIRLAVDEFRFEHSGRRFHIGASIGWVQMHQGWANTASVLQAADSACYVAKKSGRNRVHAYEDNDSAVLAKKQETLWAQRIEESLEQGRFELHWQRIVALAPQSKPGVRGEVLLRMIDLQGRRLSPAEFVPVAERFFLASRMDLWVVRNVLEWMRTHRTELQKLERLSVNLSGQSVGDPEFRVDMLQLMDTVAVDCSKLCFEVTETTAITNLQESIGFFLALRARGAKIALDDFGSGMSSFSYLKTLPADVLKIDGQFMRKLLTDPVDRVSVQSMAQLAKATAMETVAEWVETQEVEHLLRGLGVDYVQGYLHHRPAPLDELLQVCTPV